MSEFRASLLYFFETGLYLRVVAVIGFGLLLMFALRLQRTAGKIDFSYLIVDDNNRVSASKIFQLGCFAISSWAFCYLTLQNALAEWYFTTYMLCWTGTQLANKWLAIKGANTGVNGGQ